MCCPPMPERSARWAAIYYANDSRADLHDITNSANLNQMAWASHYYYKTAWPANSYVHL